MGLRTSRLAAATALAAACSMLATPAAAQGRYGARDRGGIDIGEVIGGVVVLGTIAAIASAASRGSRGGRVDEGQAYPGNQNRFPEQSAYMRGAGVSGGAGLDRAADMCVAEVQRARERVVGVDNVSRGGDGWTVSGQLQSGTAFSCRIGNDGRISDVNLGSYGYGDGTAPAARADDDRYYVRDGQASGGQWDDQAYARARAGAGVATGPDGGPWANDVPPLPEPGGPGGWDSPDYDTGGWRVRE